MKGAENRTATGTNTKRGASFLFVIMVFVVGSSCNGCLLGLIAVTLVATWQYGKCQDVNGKYKREEFHRGKCR